MLEAVVQLLFTTVVMFFVLEILVTSVLGYKMIRRAYLNHLNDQNWRTALISVGAFLLADAFNDSFWAWHLAQSQVMRHSPQFFWSLIPAFIVSTAAMFMAWAFYTRSAFFEKQISLKKEETED